MTNGAVQFPIKTYYDDLIADIDGDWTIDYDDLDGVTYDLDMDNQRLILNCYGLRPAQALASPYFAPQIELAMIEGLRMIRHVEWLDGSLDQYHPETIIQIGRVCVADAMAHKVKTAWDCKVNRDQGSLWKHLLCSDLSDMAQAFAKAYESYIDAGIHHDLAMKKSTAMAFNTWYAGFDRVRDCDHDTLNLMDEMVDDQTYFGTKILTTNTLRCLTLMAGDGSSYLDSHLCEDVIYNPYYVMINDPINQAHITQIINDMNKTRIGHVVFQDKDLASKFFVL